MKILIDTNIILDVLLKREPFYQAGAKILNLSKHKNIELYISASAVTDIYYYSVALLQEMDGVVMRNPTDYKEAEIMIWKPEDLLSQIKIPE